MIDLPCFTDSFFVSSAALFPYVIDINAKMAIEMKATLIVFKRVLSYIELEYRYQAVLCAAKCFTLFIAFHGIDEIPRITD